MTPIRLVCFDLGGVIVQICRTWAEGCAEAGLDVRGDVDSAVTGSSAWSTFHDDYQRGKLTLKSYTEQFTAMLDGLYTPEEIERVHHAWTCDEYDGVEQLVADIHAAGVETAVFSNTSHDHWITFEDRYPTFRRLRNRHGSHLLGVTKPDPAAYRAVEETTGMSGEAVLFFDDLEPNVQAARTFGWRAEQVDHTGDTAAQMRSVLESHKVL